MSLAPGTKLGPYEIVAPLGAGGMGEVYRARDPRLGRDVAIKVLPEAFAADPERLARFEREARLLAALDHPNIARILGLEELGGVRALVLELAEGDDLTVRLSRGALPADEATAIALQIARALEHAHERGIVHRDLKPANVKVGSDGVVKVLDFGLARAFEGDAAASDPRLSQSPTVTRDMTVAGVILGTAAYMSPEQARGRTADRRADIWSFGVVMYEMFTGTRPFAGETVSEILASVIKDPVDFAALPATLPPHVRALVERCLTRDPAERLRDIGEARIALSPAGAASSLSMAGMAAPAATPPTRRWVAPAMAAVLAVAATTVLLWALRSSPVDRPVRRFRVPVQGLTQHFFTALALTRDGRALAYEADDRIWIRRLDRADAIEVPGSAKGRSPFWSWNDATLCFVSEKKLWAFVEGSDQPRELCTLPESGEIVGGAWGADDRIVLAVWRGGLYEVSARGGEVRLTVPADSATIDFHGPNFLPDGRTVLLTVHDRFDRNAVAIVEGTPPKLRRIYDAPQWSSVSYSPTGHLLATAEELRPQVWAAPFSVTSRKVTGPPFLVRDGVAFASVSLDGMMAALVAAPSPMGQLAWRRRDGGGEVTIGEPQQGLSGPVLSPDGDRVAYVAETDGNADVWVRDLVRGTRTRLTSSPEREQHPSWSPDGTHVYYASEAGVGHVFIVAVASDGAGEPDTVGHGYQPVLSPDGASMVCTIDRRGSGDLWIVPVVPGGEAKPFLTTSADETAPSLSPDGQWITYASDESGRSEIYLRGFPKGDARAQVSVNGGSWPRWTRRGDGIFYAQHDTMMLVPVRRGPRPWLGMPQPLFPVTVREFDLSASIVGGFPVDAHPDGVRFLCARQVGPPASPSLLFVENWFEEFRKK
ncbi:MAG: protein kinase [Candidatus Eisenbacteria bacterium]|uniref:Protein kinase n=1 Tax=Eiseniibacteriota bacterium TaxID=2212470 RepID=A0A933SIP2_UNCEI|nr:protein kinase [Candidatus Eisenbacteria bacterium]